MVGLERLVMPERKNNTPTLPSKTPQKCGLNRKSEVRNRHKTISRHESNATKPENRRTGNGTAPSDGTKAMPRSRKRLTRNRLYAINRHEAGQPENKAGITVLISGNLSCY
ncbi:MAG: hypothetical protein D3910_01690 [Candidatus Electrothrix sp. ATG2]|nr:hypothetical protein [Candidatus Electrothrix sp. ATG2]